MFTVTATLCLAGDNKNNIEPAATLLASLLDILLGMLTYTSRVVRQALQAQKSGSRGDIQVAEDLLLLSKPLTDLINLLIPLLPSEDPEISEASSKCLSILVQLYGGENPDSLSPENLETFANLLVTKEDPKDQKLLLRILRRMVTSNEKHLKGIRNTDNLLQALRRLAPAHSSPVDTTVASLALELLQAVGP
ncbi:Serine/threonine-protein kinase ULK4 [Lemmus lemmus]